MERKTFTTNFAVKAGAPAGVVVAKIASMGVIDGDNDLLLDGCIGEQPVRMQPYSHNTSEPSIGRGRTFESGGAAFAELQINLNMAAGRELYESLKFDLEHDPPLTEWSFIYDVIDSAPGTVEGRRVRVLKALRIHSCDAVFLGAGIDTRTVSVKSHRTLADSLRELDAMATVYAGDGGHGQRERARDLLGEREEARRAAKRAVGNTDF